MNFLARTNSLFSPIHFRSSITYVRCLFLILSLFLTSCSSTQVSKTSSPLLTKQLENCRVRIVILQDKSLSIYKNRVPQIKQQDLQPLIDLLRSCSGEISVGVISDNNFEKLHDLEGKPLTRLRIEKSPEPPSSPPTTQTRNPIFALQEQQSFRKEKELYEQALAQWNKTTESRIVKFKKELEYLIELKAASKHTDIVSPFVRGNLFLSEPQVGSTVPSQKFFLLLTDGQHDASKFGEALSITGGVELILVNGAGRTGILKLLQPLRFENLGAAINFVINSARNGEN